MAETRGFTNSPVVPVDELLATVHMTHYCSYASGAFNAGVQPFQYTGWRDEERSWHDTCYIHSNLNPSPTYRFWGPDAITILRQYCANSFDIPFPVGKAKHAIFCDEQGRNMIDGMLLKLDEEEYLGYWITPWLQYLVETSGLDVQGEDLTGKTFLFQLGGPTSLQVVEAASGDNLHDIKFIHHRMSKIAGRDVRILRVGMAGSLAYEVAGKLEDAIPVYEMLIKAGEKYGLRKLGTPAYNMTHWENGFPQAYLDFPLPWFEHEGFAAWLREKGIGELCDPAIAEPTAWGSMPKDFKCRYRNPIELGWGKTVNYDHDFYGKEALEKIRDTNSRVMVTLEWNKEDVLDIERSQLEDEDPYMDIRKPDDISWDRPYHADRVEDVDGNLVGVSTGRMIAWYYREMISLCSIEREFAEEGTEVWVVWGNEGMRQKKVRAKVARYPYFDVDRNQNVDVSLIPQGTMD